jgi:large subunit ribosomal protein L15
MQLHELTKPSSRRSARRIGRGSTRGKTSGKGHKGQKSRAGHRIRPAERDIIKRIPKLRGHGINRSKTVNSGKVRPEVVNLTVLEKTFTAGDEVSPKSLAQKGIVSRSSGRLPQVKILGTGTLTKKLSVSGCTLSATAQRAIEAAGGSVAVVAA